MSTTFRRECFSSISTGTMVAEKPQACNPIRTPTNDRHMHHDGKSFLHRARRLLSTAREGNKEAVTLADATSAS